MNNINQLLPVVCKEEMALRYRAFDCSPASLLIIQHKSLKLIDANNKALEVLGYTREQLLELVVADIMVLPDYNASETAFENILKSKEKLTHLLIGLIRKDSNTIKVEVQLEAFKNEEDDYFVASFITNGLLPAEFKTTSDIVKIMADAIIVTNENFLITNYNREAAILFGWNDQEAVGKAPKEIISSNFQGFFFEDIRAKLCESGFWQGEIITSKQNGGSFNAFISITCVKNQAGKIIGASFVVREIPVQKQQEKNISELSVYQTIVETAQEGIWRLDENHTTSFVNDFLAGLLGYTKQEMLGRSLFDFMNEDARQKAMFWLKKRMQGIAEQHEFTFRKKDRSLVHTLLRASPILEQGKYTGALAMVLDITERKKAEENFLAQEKRFQAIFTNSADGITLLSADGVVLDLSYSFESIFGYNRDEVVGTRGLNMIVPEYIPLIIDTVKAVIAQPAEVRTVEFEALKKDGTKTWIECSYKNLLFEPSVNALVSNFRDITARKNIESELKVSEARYRKAQAMGKLGHWELVLETNTLYWSDEIYNIFELTPAITNPDFNTFFDLVHPEDKDKVANNINAVLAGSSDYNIIHRIVLHSGAIRYLHEVAEVAADEIGNPVKLVGTVQDVTEQKLIQMELNESRQQLSLIFNNTVNGMCLFNIEEQERLRFIEINDPLATAIKLKRDEVLGKLLEEVFDNTEVLHLQNCYSQAIRTGLTAQFTAKSLRREGNRIVEYSAVPIKNNEGEVKQLLSVSNDVTERKRAEENYKLLFNENPVPLWMLSAGTLKFLEVNTAAIKQYGYSRDEFLNLSLQDILAQENVVSSDFDGARKGFTSIVRHKKKNGEVIYVQITTNQTSYNGDDVWLVSSRDITREILFEKNLKESQEQLSLIFNSTLDAMWLLKVEDSRKFRIENINAAYTKIAGINKNDAIGKLGSEVLDQRLQTELERKYEQIILSGKIGTFFTEAVVNGNEITAQVTIIPIKNEKGKVERLLGVANNVTEQQRTRKELLKMNRQLRELASHLQNIREEERASMAREIHDELGQKLTAIKMDVAWLNRKLGQVDNAISERIIMLFSLIDDTISSVRKLAAELRPSILDDLGLAEAIDWQGREFSERTNIPVQFHSNVQDVKFPAALSIAVFRIFQEALTNVARHANAQHVNCSLVTKDGKLQLIITDDGKGFDLKNKSRKKTLGLLGMKERVAMLSGDYIVNSAPGRGTTVQVDIPFGAKTT